MEIVTLYSNHDFSKFSYNAALYKIYETGYNIEFSEVIFTKTSFPGKKEAEEIIDPRPYSILDTGKDFWMIVDKNKNFVFFSYGA